MAVVGENSVTVDRCAGGILLTCTATGPETALEPRLGSFWIDGSTSRRGWISRQ